MRGHVFIISRPLTESMQYFPKEICLETDTLGRHVRCEARKIPARYDAVQTINEGGLLEEITEIQ